jgi:uncharacterized repeat protein (TIGR01451 family)
VILGAAIASASDAKPRPGTAGVPSTADLALTKIVNTPRANLGDAVTFAVTLTNLGPAEATGVEITDGAPPGLTFTEITTSGSTTYADSTWMVGTLASDSTATLVIRATLDQLGTHENTARVTASDQEDPNDTNDQGSATVSAVEADLGLTKSVSDSTPSVGDDVMFTVTVTNYGPDDASGIVVSDPPVLGLAVDTTATTTTTGTFARGDWTLGSLPSGESAELSLVARVLSPDAIVNTAAITRADQGDPVPGNGAASAPLTGQAADLVLSMSADDVEPAPGDTVFFSVQITNFGPSDAMGIEVSNVQPPGLAFVTDSTTAGSYSDGHWTLGSLPFGSSANLWIRGRVDGALPIRNEAEILRADPPDLNPNNNAAGVTLSTVMADLALTKSVDAVSPNVGGTVMFTVTLTNHGPDDATDIEVTDAAPDGLTFQPPNPDTGTYADGVWSVESLAVDSSAVLAITARVDRAGSITNTATITATGAADELPGNDRAGATLSGRLADLEVTKCVSAGAPGCDPQAVAALGDSVTFTVTITNRGPDPATSITVRDSVPDGLGFGSITATEGFYVDGTWRLPFELAVAVTETLTIVAGVDSVGQMANVARITGRDQYDPNPFNDEASASVFSGSADLQVLITTDQTNPNRGTDVTFTITATNHGPDEAPDVEVADSLPPGLAFVSATPSRGSYAAGVWTLGDPLPTGAIETLEIVATVEQATPLTNVATISSSERADEVYGNNSASVTIVGNEHPLFASINAPVATLGADVTVSAAITDPDGVVSPAIHYAPGGPGSVRSVGMVNLSGDVYQGVVPAADVTSLGLVGYLTAEDSRGFEGRSERFAIRVAVPNQTRDSAQPGGSEQTAYRLFSVPLDLDDESPAAVLEDDLGEYDSKSWRFFELRSDQAYTEFPGTVGMAAGRSFWLAVKEPGKVIDTGPGTTVEADTSFAIDLHPQWNFVGNPFTFSIPLSNVALESGGGPDILTYEGGNGWISPGMLVPYEGYAIWANGADHLRIDPDLAPSPSPGPAADPAGWAVRIRARVQDAHDAENTAAIAPTASDGFDARDRIEPPVIGGYVSVAFDPPAGSGLPGLRTDARPEVGEGQVWRFTVRTNIPDRVELRFEGIAEVPEEHEVWLADEQLQIAQDLRGRNTHAFVSRGKENVAGLRLLVGPRPFVDAQIRVLDLIPPSFVLAQNFPNPFRGLTTIRYGVPRETPVTLRIYNVLGQEVSTLVDGEPRTPGYHVEIWDRRNGSRHVVASGVYFCVLRAGDETRKRKLVVLR